jgi:initiation factor 1A
MLKMSCSVLKVWINQGDIILIGLRDYQDAKADVILKYTPDEARNLKTYGEFPETGRGLLEFHLGFAAVLV